MIWTKKYSQRLTSATRKRALKTGNRTKQAQTRAYFSFGPIYFHLTRVEVSAEKTLVGTVCTLPIRNFPIRRHGSVAWSGESRPRPQRTPSILEQSVGGNDSTANVASGVAYRIGEHITWHLLNMKAEYGLKMFYLVLSPTFCSQPRENRTNSRMRLLSGDAKRLTRFCSRRFRKSKSTISFSEHRSHRKGIQK